MQIETYEIEEVNSECATLAADSESVELINKLGLTGQRELMDPKTDTRCPYPAMDSIQLAVYRLLFPIHVEIEKYNRGIIPLRVLQVAAYCKELPSFKRIQVWHSEVPKEDPILVGCTTSNDYEWNSTGPSIFILARWGEALKPFDELRIMAAKKWSEIATAKLLTIKAQVDSLLSNINAESISRFAQGKSDYPELTGM